MKKYFGLQMKLAARQFPFVLTVTVVLLVGLGIVLSGLLSVFYDDQATKQFTVGITGDTDDDYLQWGLAALQSFEEDRFTIAVEEMTEDQARSALEKGEISAYVILPEDFMANASRGELTPVTYVTSAGMEGVADLLKKEITQIVTEIVVQSLRGAFGLEEAMWDNGFKNGIYDDVSTLSLQYTDLILHREELYSVKELGLSDGLSTRDYYLCSVTVILLVLMGIPFATVYIRKDHALSRLLLSRGCPTAKQFFCEFCAYLLSMLALTAVVLWVGAELLRRILPPESGALPALSTIALRVLPVVMMLTAMNMLLFTCCDNLVSGLLLHFFQAIGLCYISGCIYPVYAFPKAIWPVAGLLPTGFARSVLATGFSGEPVMHSLAGIAFYTVAFYGIALWVRARKTAGNRG